MNVPILQRIFSTLLSKGRSTIQQLAQNTSLTPRELRHGLAVLLQHNLLFFYADPNLKSTFYEANADHAYNLVRTGKILEMVETSFGPSAKDVMQNLILLGQTRVSDLTSAYQGKINQAIKAALENESSAGTNGQNGHANQTFKTPDLVVKSSTELNSILCRLVDSELIAVVHRKTFQTPDDIYKDVESEITARFPGGVRGTRAKNDLEDGIASRLRAIRDESRSLKRDLELSGFMASPTSKRRKLLNGFATASAGLDDDDLDQKEDYISHTLEVSFCTTVYLMDNTDI
jgi:DNA-directed RNA polymerase III subunit RPC3